MEQAEVQGQMRLRAPPEPALLAGIPWDLAQEVMGIKATVFLAFVVRLSHRLGHEALREQGARLEREMTRQR